jgi:hypothetical protein
VTAQRQCGTPWGVCSRCPGEGLIRVGPEAVCLACSAHYPPDRPCPEPATVVLEDQDGTLGAVCASHAAHPSARLFRKRPLREVRP